MGGRIWLESEAGKGSTFHFTAHFGVSQQPATIAAPASHIPEGLAVLVVDDNSASLRILDGILRAQAIQPVLATSAEDALGLLGDYSFDVMLSDILMPQMDGFELVRTIQQRWPQSPMKIVTLSTLNDHLGPQSENIQGRLTKPVGTSDVLRVLAALFPNSSAEDGSSMQPGGQEDAGVSEVVSLSVLIAEDNPVNQMLATRILEKAGHRPTLASDGRLAVDLWEQGQFDLILMDIQMPEMDGFAACAAIREKEALQVAGSLERAPRIPIVAVTARAMSEDRDRCLAAGMDGFISKPIKLEELLAVIANLCPRSSGGLGELGPAETVAAPQNA